MIGTMEQMLKAEDVARRLNVSVATVRRWLRSGELAGIQFANEWRIDPEDLQKFINRKKGPKKEQQGGKG